VQFTWDDQKNRDNVEKHKIHFAQAVHVFSDPLRQEYYDGKHSIAEDRFLAIGFAENAVLIVSFTEPDTETVRIISARKAKKHEMEALQYGNS